MEGRSARLRQDSPTCQTTKWPFSVVSLTVCLQFGFGTAHIEAANPVPSLVMDRGQVLGNIVPESSQPPTPELEATVETKKKGTKKKKKKKAKENDNKKALDIEQDQMQ